MVNVQEVLKQLTSADLLSEALQPLGYVPTGSYALNRVISGKYDGGIPIGGITEIMGESSTGKTIFLTHIFAEAQKLGYYCALADNEFSYDPGFSEKMGVDSNGLLYYPGETVPQCFEWFEKVIKEIRDKDPDTPIVLGLDSMAGQSDAESEKDSVTDQTNMDGAIRAKEIGSILRRFNPMLRKNKVALVLINQVRNKVGVLHGDPSTRSGGGKSLEFYCAVSMQVLSNKTSDVLRDSDKQVIGIQGKLRNKKNKVSVPFLECPFSLTFSTGIDAYGGLSDFLVHDGILEQKGAWLSHEPSGQKFYGKELPKVIQETAELRSLFP